MTTFFNKKEEVIDLEMTPFGEALLSIGQFKPVYYAFLDDDVLYDASGSAGIDEIQNDVEPRIQNDTPNIKARSVYSGIESNLVPLIHELRFDRVAVGEPLVPGGPVAYMDVATTSREYNSIAPSVDRNFSFVEPLGTMELGSKDAPAWNVRVLSGELTGALNYLTSSVDSGIYSKVRRIPQLDFDINYKILVGNTADLNPYGSLARENRVLSDVYEDGTFLYLAQSPPNLIMVIDEDNSPIDLEYDIEVFEMGPPETPPNDSEVSLTTLSFLNRGTQVVNGILRDEDITPRNTMLDSSFAEYFFLINVDEEIPSEDICPVLEGIEERGITLNSIPYDCKDVRSIGRVDIYGTNAREEDPCED